MGCFLAFFFVERLQRFTDSLFVFVPVLLLAPITKKTWRVRNSSHKLSGCVLACSPHVHAESLFLLLFGGEFTEDRGCLVCFHFQYVWNIGRNKNFGEFAEVCTNYPAGCLRFHCIYTRRVCSCSFLRREFAKVCGWLARFCFSTNHNKKWRV